MLYKLRSRVDLQVNELEDAKGLNTGVVRDDLRHTFLRNAGFTRLVVSASPLDNLRKLLTGQVDVMPLSPRDARYFYDILGERPDVLEPVIALDTITTHAYLAFSRTTPDEVVGRAVTAFEQLKREGIIKRLLSPP